MGNSIQFQFSNISEHDVDLLIIEEMAFNKLFSDIFFNSINIYEYEILEISHSESHSKFGETDIQVIYLHDNKRHALLIEDKINAIAMPEQEERYHMRGDELVKDNRVSSYKVFICAPKEYIDSNSEAKKYPHKVTYEQLLDVYKDSNDKRTDFKKEVLKFTLSKKNKGYDPIVNDNITDFWEKLYDYEESNYPNFIFNRLKTGRGDGANWPLYSTHNSSIRIFFKSDRGYVDLSVICKREDLLDMKQILTLVKEEDMLVVKTGKSISIRLITKPVDFKLPFEDQLEEIDINLEAINRLYEFNAKIEKLLLKFTN